MARVPGERGFLDRIHVSRGLDLGRVTSRGVGVVVTVVAFALLSGVVATAGSFTPLAVLLVAVLIGVNGLSYAEMAATAPRSSGAYALVHDGPGRDGVAFLTGWTLILSSLGLCGLLTQCAVRYVSLLLVNLFGLDVPSGLLEVALVGVAMLGGGLVGGKGRRRVLDFLLVILLGGLVILALPQVQLTNYTAAHLRLGPAIAELVIAFAGLEVIACRGEEIRRQGVSWPRALFIALVWATILGAAVTAAAVGVTGPRMLAETETPLVLVGGAVAGVAGRATVLIVGVVALPLFLAQALTVIVRQLYVMSQDGFWPAWLQQVHPRRGVPVRLILLIGVLILPVVWIPTKLLSQVSGLLYLFVLMAVNLTLVLRPRRDRSSSTSYEGERVQTELLRTQSHGIFFSLPFHPWVPALTLAVDFLVIPLWGLLPVAWSLGCLAVGGLIYLLYGRGRHIEAQEGVIVFRSPAKERTPDAFRVLVPVANPATVRTLLRVAAYLARARGGEVLALRVVVVPEPMPLEVGRRRAQAGRVLWEKALAVADDEDLPVQTITRVARSVARGILDAASDEGADVILLGWRNPTRSRTVSLGSVADAVLRNASCDVLIARGEDAMLPRKILVPTAGGPHARAAARVAMSLAGAYGAEVTLLGVQREPATSQQIEENRLRIVQTLEGLPSEYRPEQKVVLASGVVEGVVEEANGYDLVLLGVSEETLLDRLMFGSVPLQVAMRVPATILIQGYHGLTGLWKRRAVRALLDVLPTLSAEEQLEVYQELSRGAQPGINYFVLIVLSCIIAALGLLLDSPAVVIGAMLVAPLMSPIMAFSLGLVLGDLRLTRFSTEAILKGVALAVIITAFIGLLSPIKGVTGEMLARAQPTLLDMGVALMSGMAGAYALARKDVSAALPGVAIAAALMPPLATVGLGLSLGDARVAGGAFLLFVTNIAAISLAGGVVFLLLGIRPQTWGRESRRRLWRRMVASFILLLVIAVPLGIIMGRIVRDTTQEQVIWETLTRYLEAEGGRLVDLEVERGREGLLIVATVRSIRSPDQEAIDHLAEALREQLDRPVQLELVVLPILRSSRELRFRPFNVFVRCFRFVTKL